VSWAPGDVIVRREVWQGRPWLANPLYVVEDTDDLLVLYQPEGSPWGFGPGDDWPTATGRHPYHGRTAWVGEGPLGLHRPGDPYAVWAYWRRPGREPWGWYVNIQMPFRRTEIGIDSLDLELDLLVSPTYEVTPKDEEHVFESASLGRFSRATGERIHALGEQLAGEIRTGPRWWDDAWSRWVPPVEMRRAPALDPGWLDAPAAPVEDLLGTT
jgi:hypothetical protein